METRGVASAGQAESQQTKDQSLAAQQQQQQSKPKVKQPGVSYRATLQKLSNTISLSSAEVLSRYAKSEPSLTLHFHENHWKFDQQDGIFLYNSPGRQILEAIRNEQIPIDCLEVFRDVKIKYYEGCLILKLIDYRQTPPSVMFTALKPSPESIWTEMLLYSEQTQGNFTDAKALQVESDILVATNPPLDLRPCIHPELSAKILNDVKDAPLPRMKRKRDIKYEDDEEQRLMYMYDEHHGKEFAPDFKRLAFVEAHRRKRAAQQRAAQANGTAAAASTQTQPSANVNGSLQRASQSPMVQQQMLPHTNSGSPAPMATPIPHHVQQRPSASPQPGARQLQHMNQQALAQQMAQQNMPNGIVDSPRQAPVAMQMLNQSPGPGQSPLQTQTVITNDLARQQQLMLQQRAIAIRNMNAARAAQAQMASSPRPGNNNLTQQNGMSVLQGLPNVMQGTPTPMQMQQIRQMQAQQQAQQMAHAQQQAAAASQQSQMGFSNGTMR